MEQNVLQNKTNNKASAGQPDLVAAKWMCRHPFVSAAAVCLCCTVLTTAEVFGVFKFYLPGILLFLCAQVGTDYMTTKIPKLSVRAYTLAAGFASFLFSIAFSFAVSVAENPQMIIMQSAIIACVLIALYLIMMGLMTAKKASLLLMVSGFFVRLAYVMSITIQTKQHDAGSVEKMKGHIGYVAYLLYNGTLPQMDVRTVDQFYHPPLHHIIAALWVKLQTLLGIDSELAFENIQILTLFYSCACMIIAYKLFRRSGLRGAGLVCAMAVVSFCPTFYILAGSINNDILCITFMLASLLCALIWLDKRTFGWIMCTAVCVGCAMMSKLSGWMVAPAIAVIFVYGLVKDFTSDEDHSKTIKKYALQFGAFLPVSAALGLWWGIRNLIRDGVSIAFIIRMSDKSDMYVGNVPLLKRLFSLDPAQFEEVATGFERYGVSYNEYNPMLGLIKTSAFDELFTVNFFPSVEGYDHLLCWCTIVVAAIGFVSMVYCLIADKSMRTIHKSFYGALYSVIIISYYGFCISYPHICTMNIRYAVPLIVVGAYFVGRAVMISSRAKEKFALPGRIISNIIMAATGLYSVSSVLFYMNVFK